MDVVVLMLVIFALFFALSNASIRAAADMLEVGDVYCRTRGLVNYDKTDPFGGDLNVYAKIIEIKEDEYGEKWVRYYLYKHENVMHRIEASQTAYSFVMIYDKVE